MESRLLAYLPLSVGALLASPPSQFRITHYVIFIPQRRQARFKAFPPSNPSTKENDTFGRPTPPIRRTRTKTSMFMPKPKKQEGIQGQNVSLSFTGMLPDDTSRELIDKWKPRLRAEWRASAACARATQRSSLLAKRSMNKVVGREHAQSTASKGGKALGLATVKAAALSTGPIRTSATESTKNKAAVGSCDSYKKQLRHASY